MSIPVGVQLGIYGYGIFGDRPEHDLAGVLSDVVATGYTGVEIMTNLMPQGAGHVRKMLDERGVQCTGIHGFYKDFAAQAMFADMLAFAVDVGIPRLICSGVADKSIAGYERSAEIFNELGRQCREAGVRFFYHNHDKELVALEEGRCGLDILLAHTEQELVGFNIDVYWASVAGRDIRTLVEDLAPRSGYYHFKDGRDGTNGILGSGDVDLHGAFAALQSAPVDWIIVEQDNIGPSSIESCRLNREFLRTLGID